jgi:MoaA/NifB/PqqE/SkfB family radical SAM enzyme
MNAEDVGWVHVETSTKCNAWCPACPRNNNGFGLAADVVEQDLTPAKFEEIIAELPKLQTVQLCGNLGDPIASTYINELIDISKKYAKKIQIHTNGSLRNVKWWKQLAQSLSNIDHDVWFGIDGLAGVHEIYRQGTSFEKIINNAQAFISNGGHASWQFIPYKHNEHQVMECLKLSQQLNFKKFHLVKLYRNQTLAKHYQTGEEFDLLPTDSVRKLIKINQIKKPVDEKNCMHLSIPSIYVSAAGDVSRCCYLSKNEKFSSVNELLKTVITDLSDEKCIRSCG